MCGQLVNWFNVHKILIAFKRPRLVSLLLIGRSANEQLCGCFTAEENKLNPRFFSSVRKANSVLLAFSLRGCDGTLESVIGPKVLGGSNTYLQKMTKSLTTPSGRFGNMYLLFIIVF